VEAVELVFALVVLPAEVLLAVPFVTVLPAALEAWAPVVLVPWVVALEAVLAALEACPVVCTPPPVVLGPLVEEVGVPSSVPASLAGSLLH
jgi:hypothetical protein